MKNSLSLCRAKDLNDSTIRPALEVQPFKLVLILQIKVNTHQACVIGTLQVPYQSVSNHRCKLKDFPSKLEDHTQKEEYIEYNSKKRKNYHRRAHLLLLPNLPC